MLQLKYFVVLLFLGTALSRHRNFYRKDYTYIYDLDAYYKLHYFENGCSWKTAFLTCENEEAKLFYPVKTNEWQVVNQLKEKMVDPPNATDTFIGVHNMFGIGVFVPSDGSSAMLPMGEDLQQVEAGDICVTLDSDTGLYEKGTCTRTTPTLFVCKKLDPEPIEACPTIDPDYKYSSSMRKCYKMNNKAKSWQQAYETCYMEGGQLAVAVDNSDLSNLLSLLSLSQDMMYFIGVRDLFNNGCFYTVKGDRIGDVSALYGEQASNNQMYVPSNPDYGSEQHNSDYGSESEAHPDVTHRRMPIFLHPNKCGVVSFRDRYGNNKYGLRSISCNELRPFICEMDAK